MSDGDLREQPICDEHVTDYDEARRTAYMRLLDAAADGASWCEAAAVIFGIDVQADPDRAQRIHQVHLARARWIAARGLWGLRTSPPR
jgi:hypothetical protein